MVVYKYVNTYWATPMTTKPSRRKLQNSSPRSWVAKEKDLQTLMFGSLQRYGWVSLTYLQQNLCVCVAQSCLTLCSPLDYTLPGSSIHWILHARTLEWVAIPFLQGIFLIKLSLQHCRQILYHLSHQGSPHNRAYPSTNFSSQQSFAEAFSASLK